MIAGVKVENLLEWLSENCVSYLTHVFGVLERATSLVACNRRLRRNLQIEQVCNNYPNEETLLLPNEELQKQKLVSNCVSEGSAR